jgi:hypothetical protein
MKMQVPGLGAWSHVDGHFQGQGEEAGFLPVQKPGRVTRKIAPEEGKAMAALGLVSQGVQNLPVLFFHASLAGEFRHQAILRRQGLFLSGFDFSSLNPVQAHQTPSAPVSRQSANLAPLTHHNAIEILPGLGSVIPKSWVSSIHSQGAISRK